MPSVVRARLLTFIKAFCFVSACVAGCNAAGDVTAVVPKPDPHPLPLQPMDTSLLPLKGVQLPLHGKILFVSDEKNPAGNLFMMNTDGSGLMQITTDALGFSCVSSSPDGRRVAFIRQGRIYTMLLDRSDFHVLAVPEVGANFNCPVWSKDGSKLAFLSSVLKEKQPITSTLYSVNADDSSPIRLLSGLNFFNIEWSPDGSQILFSSASYSPNGGLYDFIINVVSSDGLRRTTVPGGYWDVAWSPSGGEFAFDCGTQLQICIASSDGSRIRQLTNSDSSSFNPRWSPDGNSISYICVPARCVMNADGTSSRQIIPPSIANGNLTWSPDSRRLAFSCLGSGQISVGVQSQDICTVNADGTNFRRLTNSTPRCWSSKMFVQLASRQSTSSTSPGTSTSHKRRSKLTSPCPLPA